MDWQAVQPLTEPETHVRARLSRDLCRRHVFYCAAQTLCSAQTRGRAAVRRAGVSCAAGRSWRGPRGTPPQGKCYQAPLAFWCLGRLGVARCGGRADSSAASFRWPARACFRPVP